MRVIPYLKVSELDRLMRSFLPLGEDVRFVVPSRRDRSWWRERTGQGEFGPDEPPAAILWNWQDLYEDLCAFCEAKCLRPIEPPDHRLILNRLLGALLKEEPELLALWPGLGRAGFLDILSEDVRELLNEAVLPEQAEAGLPEGDPTAQILPRLYRSYLEYLEDNGLMDSAQVCTAALELLDGEPLPWGGDLTIVFSGFLSFTQAQIRLIRRLNTRCREVVILKPETALPDFHDAARQLEGLAWEEPPQPNPGRIVQMSAAECELEAEAVARALALWNVGRGPLAKEGSFPGFGAIGMMLPVDGEEAAIEALSRFAIPYTPARGTPVDRTLPGRMLSATWTLWSRDFPTYETALLLDQPCFAGDRLSVPETLRAGPRGLASWKAYLKEDASPEEGQGRKRTPAVAAIAALERFGRALSRGGTPSELMGAFHRFLTEKGLWLERLAALPLQYPELDDAIRTTASAIDSVREKFLALRELLPDIGPAGRTPLKGDEAAEFLLSWCRETRIRPELPLSGAVTLYLGPPPVLASHPIWIMLGVSQREWPGRIAGSPLLGSPERERLAEAEAWLPSVQDKRLQREALFRRLVHTGENLTLLSRPEADENGRPLPDTPFLERFVADLDGWSADRLPAAGVEILLPCDGHIFPEADAPLDGRPPRFTPSAADRAGGAGLPNLAVSALQTLLECPLRYWLQARARLRERPLGLATAADWGSLAHKFWERVWRRFGREREPFPELVEAEWQTLASAQEDYEAFGRLIRDRRLARGLEVLRFRVRRLGTLQARLLERLRQSGFRHEAVLLEEEAELACEWEGVRFSGRCDRVEVLEDRDGRTHAVITDYKSGRSPRYEEGMKDLRQYSWHSRDDGGPEQIRRGLQLSAYALMYGSRQSAPVLSGVCFLGHQDGGLAGTFAESLRGIYGEELQGETRGNRCTLEERRDEARYAMTCAARLLREGRFSPFYDSPACRYCDMKSLCRRGETMGEPLRSEEEPEE